MAHQESIFEGKSLDDAVRKGLDALGLSRAEVMITVMEEGSSGFLGLGSRPYKVRVMPRPGGPPREPSERRASRRERGGRDDRRGGRGDGGRGGRSGRGEGSRREGGRGGDGDRPRRERREPVRAGGEPRRDGGRREGGRAPEGEPRAPITAAREDGRQEMRGDDRPQRAEPREPQGERFERDGGRGRRRRGRRGRGGRGEGGGRMDGMSEAVASDETDMPPMREQVAAPESMEPVAQASREMHEPREHEPRVEREHRGYRGDRGERGDDRRRGNGGSRDEGPDMPAAELEAQGRRITEELLAAMGFPARVTSRAEGTNVDVIAEVSEDEDLLTGRKGEIRQALQHLLNLTLNRGGGMRYHLQLEINEFWRHREAELQEQARAMADDAVTNGREVVTEYLNAQERRVIHVTLRDDDRVKTYAIGDGLIKKLAVAPAGQPEAARAED